MPLPLLAETLIRDLAHEAEKLTGSERAAIDALVHAIGLLGEEMTRLTQNDSSEADVAQHLAGLLATFDDEQVHTAVRHAEDSCTAFFASMRLRRPPDCALVRAALLMDLESVMIALATIAAKSF